MGAPVAPEDSEMRRPKPGRRPVLPTKVELDEHFPLHLQYRSWCKHCVAGKARLAQHRVDDPDRERLGVTWNADYAFMGSEEAEEGMQPTLIMYDDDKRSFWALGVRRKGVSDSVVKFCVDKMDDSGYRGEKLTFKTDQEPSIVALKKAIAVARMGETVPIESPVRASQSNGMMEGAVKIWQDQLRTIKHHVEFRLRKQIEVDSALFSWLIPYCADIINKFRIGADGRTSYERITSHKSKHFIIGFGEVVDYVLETDKGNRHKADSRVGQGIFLGYIWRTTEYLIGTKDTVYQCRTVKRRADEVAYDPECVNYINIHYDEFVLKGAKSTANVSVPAPVAAGGEDQTLRGRDFIPRRPYLRPADFHKFGFTQGCAGCVWSQNGLGPRRNHTDQCRKRLEEHIAKDPTDDRIEKAKERSDHYLATKVDEGDEKQEQREDDPRKEPDAPEVSREDMDTGEGEESANTVPANPEYFSMDTSDPADVEEYQGPEHDLDDGPVGRSEVRVKTPERKPATKRRGDYTAAEAREGEPAKKNQCFEVKSGEGDGDQDLGSVKMRARGLRQKFAN